MFPRLKRNSDRDSGIGSGISFSKLISDKRKGRMCSLSTHNKRTQMIRHFRVASILVPRATHCTIRTTKIYQRLLLL